METLKELNKLTEPDPRNDFTIAMDPSAPGGYRRLTVAERHRQMARLELSESVPETVRKAFAVTRTLWLYGWFYWSFYTLAGFHAILCLDMALAIRIAREEGMPNPPAKTPPLQEMLKRAIESNWITDKGIAHARHLHDRWTQICVEVPEETYETSPDPLEESPQRYCRILLETLPGQRNSFAHPKHYWHGVPDSSYLIIENVHDLIQQLFHDEVVRS